jgi:hypothetical protein
MRPATADGVSPRIRFDIESLVEDQVFGSFERGNEGTRDVLDMPRSAAWTIRQISKRRSPG